MISKWMIAVMIVSLFLIGTAFAEQFGYGYTQSVSFNNNTNQVNSTVYADFWDLLDTPADINIGDLTDDNTYVEVAGDTMSGDLNMDDGSADSPSIRFINEANEESKIYQDQDANVLRLFSSKSLYLNNYGSESSGLQVGVVGGRSYINPLGVDDLYLFDSNFNPYTTDNKDLGTSSYKWRNLYLSGNVSANYFFGNGSQLTDTGDNLGDHTATQDLDMDGNDIFDTAEIKGSSSLVLRPDGYSDRGFGVVIRDSRAVVYSSGADDLAVSDNLDPFTTNAHDLGDSLLKWRDLFLSRNATIDGNVTANYFFGNGSQLTDTGDNLGNHQASLNLNMSTYNITDVTAIEMGNGHSIKTNATGLYLR